MTPFMQRVAELVGAIPTEDGAADLTTTTATTTAGAAAPIPDRAPHRSEHVS